MAKKTPVKKAAKKKGSGNRKQRRAESSVASRNGTNGAATSALLLSEGDQETVRLADKKIADLQTSLGVLTETYEIRKAQIINNISKSKQDFQTVLGTIGNKHGVDLEKEAGQWGFNFDTMEFSRRGSPSA